MRCMLTRGRIVAVAVGAHERVDVYVRHTSCPGIGNTSGDGVIELVAAIPYLNNSECVALVVVEC